MSSNTFMSPNQQPGVQCRVCHLVGAISGGRFYAPLFRARATQHITSQPTSNKTGGGGEASQRRSEEEEE